LTKKKERKKKEKGEKRKVRKVIFSSKVWWLPVGGLKRRGGKKKEGEGVVGKKMGVGKYRDRCSATCEGVVFPGKKKKKGKKQGGIWEPIGSCNPKPMRCMVGRREKLGRREVKRSRNDPKYPSSPNTTLLAESLGGGERKGKKKRKLMGKRRRMETDPTGNFEILALSFAGLWHTKFTA